MGGNTEFKIVVGLAIFMLGIVSGITFIENSANTFAFLRELPTIEQCVGSFDSNANLDALRAKVNYCYDAVYLQSQLNEFTIRRLVFQSQYSSDIVLLWMVVFITLSGVVLSGLQLFTSYRLARDGHISPDGAPLSSELELEKGKIALRSSVTGLFILMFSFAFFYVFVIFVYEIEELGSQIGSAPGEVAVNGYQKVLPSGSGEFLESLGALGLPSDISTEMPAATPEN